VIFLLTKLTSRVASRAITIFVLAVVTLSVGMVPQVTRSSSISEAAYAELQEIRGVISQPESSFVMARHGLEWWAAWVLETDAGQAHSLDEESWGNYDQVFYLRQIAGAANYGPNGPTGPGGVTFPEVVIPEDAETVFEGEYFILSRATSMPSWTSHEEGGGGGGEDTLNLFKRVEHQLREQKEIVEVADPGFQLPSGVYPAQVKKYFQLGDVYFALVLQNSMNISLDLSEGETISFVGVLTGPEDGKWERFLRIEDKGGVFKNNPYYMWSEGEEIFLTVVDHNGAGSGEGNMKLAVSHLGWDWPIEKCYYFGASYSGPQDGDYLEFSKNLAEQATQPMESCQNVTLTPERL